MRESGFDTYLTGKHLKGAEIGVFLGEHALALMLKNNVDSLLLVDPYSCYEDYVKDTATCNLEKMPEAREKAIRAFEKAKISYKGVWINKMSIEAAKMVEDNSLDFVYIDGCHAYDYVLNDIKIWFPKLKSNGIIGGHDWGREEVNRAVEDYGNENHLKITKTREDWLYV